MTGPAVKTFRRSFTLDGGRYQVDLSVQFIAGQATTMECEWTPDLPTGLHGQRWRRLLAEYRAKRNAVFEALAAEIGGQILLIDL